MESDDPIKADFLMQVSEIFPNIDTDYVTALFEGIDFNVAAEDRFVRVIDQIADTGEYPKKKNNSQQTKRKRTSGDFELDDPPHKLRHDGIKQEIDESSSANEVDDTNSPSDSGTLHHCPSCLDDVPGNQVVFCSGPIRHPCCLECLQAYATVRINSLRCDLGCIYEKDCPGNYETQRQLKQVLEPNLFQKFERLQQDEEIKTAGLAGLEECPFCDFKAICELPTEVDKEFRCLNPECEKISCRLCHHETHVPLSCKEFDSRKESSARHAVEEAMAEGLIRKCNRCQTPFIKDQSSCNKITCERCSNVQCYCCGQNLMNSSLAYQHFVIGKCEQFDNTVQRHEDDVRKAEEKAISKAKAENPQLSSEQLEIKVSEAVRNAEREESEREARHFAPGAMPRNAVPGRPPWGIDREYQALPLPNYGYALGAQLQQAPQGPPPPLALWGPPGPQMPMGFGALPLPPGFAPALPPPPPRTFPPPGLGAFRPPPGYARPAPPLAPRDHHPRRQRPEGQGGGRTRGASPDEDVVILTGEEFERNVEENRRRGWGGRG
ncbi:MAG: hypothetical protein M1822_003861 [Bathelium mastoideum]|nr:MAG: hypothetical protein M1822_003861 [Bathelium mastoideum]